MSHDLQTVKRRTVSLLAGGDGAGPRRRQAVADLEGRVAQILTQPAVRLAWPGAAEEEGFNQELNRLLGQVRTLAEGYASRGSRFEGDARVLERALAGLDNVLEHFNPDTPRPGNWYYWLIQIPDKLGATGLLLEARLPPDLRARLEAALTHELRTMELSGANAAWEARNHAYLALLQGDTERLARSAARIFETVRYSADGVGEDFSYLFHGRIPYAGAYGSGFAETVAQFMFLFDDTRWAAPPAQRQLLVNLLLEHFRWVIVGGAWDVTVCGRAHEQLRRADGALAAMLFLSQVGTDEPERVRGAAAALLDQGLAVDEPVATFADALRDTAPQPARGFRHWYTADLGAYAATEYHVGYRLYSRRVQDYEYLTQMGGRGWNLAYGFTHVSRTGREWFDGAEGARPVDDLDWDHLAGTTSRVGVHPRNDEGEGLSSFGHSLNYGRGELSGGAGLGEGGMAAFELVPTHGDFVARKSLTFFPGGFLALGSGITSHAAADEARPVHTTLLQWAAPVADTPLLVDGTPVALTSSPQRLSRVRWVLIDGVGAILPAAGDLWARRQGRVTTVWLDHGSAPSDAGYACAVLPATTQEQVAAFAAAPPVRVVQRDAAAHVVVDDVSGARAAALFAAGQAGGFVTNSPAIFYQRGDDAGGAVSVQDPLHRSDPFAVTLPVSPGKPVRVVDEEVRVLPSGGDARPGAAAAGAGTLRLRIDARRGRIYRAGWGMLGAELAPVPRVDLADFAAFRAEVEADAERAVFTVHLAPEPLREGYELLLEGRQGHRIHVFTEADLLDRPAPGVLRYVWRHGQREAALDDRLQREGDFRLQLSTDLKAATAYVTIPHFDDEGRPQPSQLPRDVNRPPAR